MLNQENMLQALLSIDKKSLKARKQGGLGTPDIPLYIYSGSKLTDAMVRDYMTKAEAGTPEGEPLILAGYHFDTNDPYGFLFTTTAVYPAKNLLSPRKGELKLPLYYRDLEAVTQTKKTGNNRCILTFRNGDQVEVFGNIYCVWFVEALNRLLPLWQAANANAAKRNVPKTEPKPAPKVEPKPAPKMEPKPAPKVEPKPAPKVEPKSAPKVEPKPAPKTYQGKDSYTPEEMCRYGMEWFRTGNCEIAAELFRCAMALGSGEGCFLLGMLYLNHMLPEPSGEDFFHAHGLVLEAAYRGYQPALAMARDIAFTVEEIFEKFGESEESRNPEADRHFHEAVAAFCAGDIKRAVSLLETTADKWNDLNSIQLLGQIHISDRYDFCNPLYGSSLLHRCDVRGRNDARKILEASFPQAVRRTPKSKPEPKIPSQAQSDLFSLAQGFEQAENREIAKLLYRQLEHDHSSANLQLGFMALKENNTKEMLKHWMMACRQGNQAAQLQMTIICAKIILEHPEQAWPMLPAIEEFSADLPPIQECLGELYLKGKDGVPCYDRGIFYLRKAIHSDLHRGYEKMAQLYESTWLDPTGERKLYVYWLEYGANFLDEQCMALLMKHYSIGTNYNLDKIRYWAEQFYECTKDREKKRVVAEVLADACEKPEDRQRWARIRDQLSS